MTKWSAEVDRQNDRSSEHHTMNWLTAHFRSLALLLLSQTPAAAGLYQCWPQAKEHPITAAALVLIWEGLIVLIAFIRSVWKEELEKDARRACADGVRALASSLVNLFRNFSPGSRRQYREHLIREYGLFNDRGLGLINACRLDLRKVFVDLRIAPAATVDSTNTDLIRRSELRGNQPIWLFLRAFGKEGLGLSIIGAPGSGKTTLLHHVLLTFAENRQWHQFMRAKIPVILFLREHAVHVVSGDPPSLAELAQDSISKQLSRSSQVHIAPGWFEKRLSAGRCIVLLDGLDEVADESDRRKVAAWVDTQIGKYHRCQFLLTARPHGYSFRHFSTRHRATHHHRGERHSRSACLWR
jgi:hypothetical protein